MEIFYPSSLYTEGRLVSNQALVVDGPTIKEICPFEEAKQNYPAARHISLPNRTILPGAVNSHSHAFQILLRGGAETPLNFQDWVDGYLYPFLLPLTPKDLYRGALLAFSEMMLHGVTTVGEFFYIHNNQGGIFESENHRETLKAADETGIRICFLRSVYDQLNKPGQIRFKETPDESLSRFENLKKEFSEKELFTFLLAPHSLHGCSQEGIKLTAEFSKKSGTPFHIHLAEEEHDVGFSIKKYQLTPLKVLEKLGALSDKTILIHGCWLDSDEITLLGQKRGGLVSNPASNMALGDGTTPIIELIKAGVTIALGTDGACANNSTNLFMEMRLAEHKQRLKHRGMGLIDKVSPKGKNPLLSLGMENGGKVLDLPIGQLKKGFFADFLVVDLDDISLQPFTSPTCEGLLNNLIFSGSIRNCLDSVYIHGLKRVEKGELVKIKTQGIFNELKKYTLSN